MIKLLTHFVCVFLVLSICSAQEQIYPLSDPANAGGWVLSKSMSDEFDGDALDPQKWNNLGLGGNYYGEWKGRAPSQYDPQNVSVGGGSLTITSRWDPTFKFSTTPSSTGDSYGHPAPVTTGGIFSRAKFKYGYLEMRCKAADGPISSSFWTTGQGGEIDVFEHYGKNAGSSFSDARLHTSFHDWRKGSATFGKRIWTNDHQLGFRVADDFHAYGLLWAENLVSIYIDGRLVNCITFADLMKHSNYQTVINGRPLFYILNHDIESSEKAWSDAGGFKTAVTTLREAARSRGLEDPYVVAMIPWLDKAPRFADDTGCDAISAYAVQAGGKSTPFTDLTAYVENNWNRSMETGAKIVPTAMTGWDRRPRVETPVFWEHNSGWSAEIERFYQTPTPEQIAEHVRDAVDWTRRNAQAAEAQTVIVYAWNEHDEGGWLCPTLGEGDARTRAMAEILSRQ